MQFKYKISIITVVKNGMPFIKDAINSINNQTLKNIEHIIVYGNSKDDTECFLKSLPKKKIIKDYISKNKFGSINTGIKKAKGEIVGLLHSDDFYPNKNTLRSLYNFYKKNHADIIYGNIKFCKRNNKKKIIRYWKSENFENGKLKYGWMPPHTSIYVKNKIIKKNKYNDKYSISGDYKFILDLFSNQNLKKRYFNRVLCIMRSGGDSTKITSSFEKLKEDLEISKFFFKKNFICIFFKIVRKLSQFKLTNFIKS